MHLKTLYLRNFRNYSDQLFQFSPGINVIAGENAQGKTNLLEVIHLISTGKSFRTNTLSQLIQFGQTDFVIQAVIEKEGLDEKITLQYDGESKKLQYNSNVYLSFNQLLGIMPSVLYEPSDIKLITGSPQCRRRFLNILIAQYDPLYVHHLVQYHRAMKQRNTLLKKKKTAAIDCWEEAMSVSGAYLTFMRAKILTELKEILPTYSELLTHQKEEISLEFMPSIHLEASVTELKNAFQKKYAAERQKELILGSTLFGAHRDDFQLMINQDIAKNFASEGQKRTLTAAIKFAEWDLLCHKADEKAIMCIDDMGIQLDSVRRMMLQESLEQFAQVFITTPYSTEHFDSAHVIKIQKGKTVSL